MTDVLLIIHDVHQDNNCIPLGPAYIAAALEAAGHKVEFYCMDVFHHSNEQLGRHLDHNEYGIIGLGFMAARFRETVEPLCRVISDHKGDATFVIGGPAPSASPDYMLEATGANLLICGEAEFRMVQIAGDTDWRYRHGSQGIFLRDAAPELMQVPMPAYHLLPMEHYVRNLRGPGQPEGARAANIITSRGCAFRCAFCYRMQPGHRMAPMEAVIAEMKFLNDKYGVTHFFIQDELFVTSPTRLYQFATGKLDLPQEITYTCQARADSITEHSVRMLKTSGCTFVNIGFESMDNEVLAEMKKGTTCGHNLRALGLCHQSELPMGLNFIWGMPSDDRGSLMTSVDTIKSWNSYQQLRTIRPVTPYPGSKLYQDALKSGKLKDAKDFYDKFTNSDLLTVNFTEFSDKLCYEWLMEANAELIADHCDHTDMTELERDRLIGAFEKLYSGENPKFRGARA